MIRRLAILAVLLATVGWAALGCAQPAAPAPTSAPAAPAKPAEPTKASAAAPAPTTAPAAQAPAAPKVDFPRKGSIIQMIIPWSAAGLNGTIGRLYAEQMSKDWGVTVTPNHQPGGTGQVGLTAIVKAKPDGYTFGIYSTPTTMFIDPERQVQFKREDMRHLSMITQEALAIGTLRDKPWSTVKGLQEYAKANPGQVRIANQGVMSATHFNALGFARNLGIEIRSVTNDDAGDSQAQLLGGHIEAWSSSVTSLRGPYKDGSVNVLGVAGTKRDRFMTDVPTFREQGFDYELSITKGWVIPAGVPDEIFKIYNDELTKISTDPEFIKKARDAGLEMEFKDSKDYEAMDLQMEKDLGTLMLKAKQEAQ